ncbi:MAG: hypothetical protein QF842_00270 [Candidatus Marinimicrobia bacterium]|jgi:hypothetical protein|nr:hypothetical protein [Candidatus Neomarinimicrobiota bacterium]MDP6611388.1 hypothetical protein [Candidatus Neomarinimicrobiota bacterium]
MQSLNRYIIFSLFALSICNAGEKGSYAGGFLRMGASARAMAMGSGFTAEIDAGFAAYHNPASLVFSNKRQLGFSHHFLPLERRFMAANFSAPLPPSASVGIAWVSAGTDKIDGRTGSGEHTQYLSTSEDAFMISFAQQILPWFSAGLNIKIIKHQLPMNTMDLAGKGMGMDFGVFIHTEKGANLAFMVQDLNSRYHWKTDKIFERGKEYVEQFPTLYRVGTTLNYGKVYLAADGGMVMNGKDLLGYTLRIGGEYPYLDHYFIRAGLGNGRMSVGVGVDWSLLKENDAKLDYAFVFENPAGAAHIFTYAFTF